MVLTVLFTIGVGSMWGETVEFDLTTKTQLTTQTKESVVFTNGGATLAITRNSSNTTAVNNYMPGGTTNASHTRVYKSNPIIFDAGTGNKIQSVTIKVTSSEGSIGNITGGTWTSTVTTSGSSPTITYTLGTTNQTVSVTPSGTSRIEKVTLTYIAEGGSIPNPEPGNAETGTINFNSGSNAVKISAASVTGEDNLGKIWTITTEGTSYYSNSTTYSQIGSGNNPATSITFTTTLPSNVNVTAFSAKFGGFSGTAGTVTLKVDGVSVGTGALNASNDVIIINTKEATGKTLTVTVTGISKGVKAYYISYTYESVISVQTFTLTNQANPDGYGTISPSSVEDIPKGTTTSKNANTYTVNGTTVTASPSAKTAQYTYAFSEWQDLPATVNSDATVTAVFTRTTNKYTITWKNGDNVLEIDNNVEYDATPQYDGATPTKAATAQYTYAFTGWNPAIASVTKDQTYTAQFSQTVNKYTITWKNADGTTLKTEEVAYGTTPSYSGTAPTKAATEQYTYTHNGWTPSVVAVTGNAEYTATFAETPRTYTIILNTNGGTINAGNVTSYKYGAGATLPTNVTKEHHQFGGWFDNSGCTGTAVTTISTTATGDKEYWAKWTELPKYTVTWSVDGNTTTEEVYSGDKATKAPTIDENNLPCDGADKFVGWTTSEYTGNTAPGTRYPTAADIPAITDDITFYAVFADYAD